LKLLAQDGHNAGQKISTALSAGVLNGVIVSAKCHEKSKVADFISENLEINNAIVLYDPEFYASALPDADNLGKLETHDYFKSGLTKADLSPKGVTDLTTKTLTAQQSYGLDMLISPSVIIEGFNSFSSAQAYSFYLSSIDICDDAENKLILTIPATQSSFSKKDEIEGFLNELTKLDVKGFYLIVDRSSAYSSIWSSPAELAGQLLLVNVLTAAGYEVYQGYTDASGLLSLAVGATGIATGWYKNLRLFKHTRYYASSGGNTPKERYFSTKLLNFIAVEDELNPIVALNLQNQVLSGVEDDEELIQNIDDPSGDKIKQLKITGLQCELLSMN